ncbi:MULTISPECIES: TolC family protein [unclassified Duganella]|uniref:TolC family protein n=1 Tax=unclassified Duganella TaxID=2636909 RepID=UPI00088EEAC3|nr:MULTISPECIES: TolC family protein [unclassified Duganella]SDF63685.1 Outer membrane efflux protein [Duganella sp. OV458]SDI64781.1 Outer membrane efflux protein [Duganella sp. OV510]
MTSLYKFASGASLVLLLSGCASLSGDAGFSAAAGISEQRTGARASVEGRLPRNEDDARALADVINKKLAQPLAADDAVQVALLNNRGLQASYWSLGVAEADLVQAGRLQNPVFDFKRSHGGGEVGYERTLTFNLVGLITAPMASRIEGRRFEQTKLLVANEALKVAADTRRAWVDAVAATQIANYAMQVEASAQASAELAERMRKAGNWSSLDQAREQAYHAQTVAEVTHAKKTAVATREKLTRLLGLSGEQTAKYRLPDHLPDLPAAPRELVDIEQVAVTERLDIQAAKVDAEQTASTLGLTRTTRFINVLDLGAVRNTEGGTATRGYEISLEIPLFDWGSARMARAEATYMQSVNQLAQAAVVARSEARESYADYRSSYDLARHYRDNVVPLRKQISDQTLLRYNGMLMSVFELLADAREQATAVSGYIGALKDYWTAEANLEAALGGRLSTNKGVQP